MNNENLKVLTNIIGAVESGGQIYGKKNYGAYADPYTNTANEHTITLGWAQNYGAEAEKLIRMIYETDRDEFKKLDTCTPSIESMLYKDWVGMRWHPNSEQKAVLKKLIVTDIGKQCQDELFKNLMQTFIKDCAKDYTKDIPAQMMYCEIRHLGGKSAANRVFKRCNGNYSLNNIMSALKQDQNDTSSSNQVGDKLFWSRHEKCKEFIEKYAVKESGENVAVYNPEKVIEVAKSQIGYLEKRSNKNLDDFTANAGSNNYTKYGRDLYAWTKNEAGDTYGVDYQWCDQFVDWCFVTAYGLKAAKKLLGGWSAYTPTSAQYYKNMGQWSKKPAIGAQIFFHNSERICHTGIVYNFDNYKVYTIEGNTTGASDVVSNGGGVCKKAYTLDNSRISGYGIPKYGETIEPDKDETSTAMGNVAEGQRWLNTYYGEVLKKYCGALLAVDGDYGPKSRAGALAVWKDLMNRKYKTTLTPNNTNFGNTCKSVARKAAVEPESTGTFTYICQFILSAKNFYTGVMSSDYNDDLKVAIKMFQKVCGLKTDGVCGAETWFELFN